MELTPSQKKTVRHQFDSFCRKVLREEARNYIRELMRRAAHEVPLSELSEEQMERLCVLDEYPSEAIHFDVQGYDVAINNEKLADALTALPDDKRDIVLLAYFLDMSDQEIADKLNMVRRTVQYVNAVKSIIAPYFRKRKILLRDLQAHDIQMFYQEQLQRVKPASVIHYHANIHKALKYAVKNDMIPTNPADKVERPKQDKFYGSFYDKEELNKLFEAVAGTKLELPVLLGAFYGLRRSEIIGLKWSAVDFEQNTITINHTVTSCNLDGKCVIVAKDTTKTKSSRRTLPLVPYFHEKLLAVKAQQEKNQKLCGRSYNKEFLEYICVDEIGDRFKPNYITTQFPKLLERNGFRKIRFHDLRHSCASLLLASGVPMKNIQEWLGHSDFSTTANIYAHLDYSSKLTSASAMESNFHLGV